MRVTLQDVADKVGISKMSVSLYLRDHNTTRVSTEVKDKIEKAIQDLKFISASSSSNIKASNILGILLPFDYPLFRYELINDYLNGIQQELLTKGYSFIFIHTHSRNGLHYLDSESLQLCRKCKGIIIFGTRHSTVEELQQMVDILNENKIPIGILNFPLRIRDSLQGFVVNDSNCDPIQYLISLGHKRIVFVGGVNYAEHTKSMVSEYRSTLKRNGIEPDENLIIDGGFESYSAYTELLKLINAGIDFSAIFSMSTQMVVGCYKALNESNLSIPKDVSVINYGDPYFVKFLNPSLTAIHLPLEKLGKNLAKHMTDSIEKRQNYINDELYLTNSLDVRLSTSIKNNK